MVVHEMAHVLDGRLSGAVSFRDQARGFYVGNGEVLYVTHKKLFPRSELFGESAKVLPDSIRKLYLTGESGRQSLDSLLEELSAYTWGLTTAAATVDLTPDRVFAGHRDGVAAFLWLIAAYFERASERGPGFWTRVRFSDEDRVAVRRLWVRAEQTLATCWNDPRLGYGDRAILQNLYKRRMGPLLAFVTNGAGDEAFPDPSFAKLRESSPSQPKQPVVYAKREQVFAQATQAASYFRDCAAAHQPHEIVGPLPVGKAKLAELQLLFSVSPDFSKIPRMQTILRANQEIARYR